MRWRARQEKFSKNQPRRFGFFLRRRNTSPPWALRYNHRQAMRRLACLILITAIALYAQGKKKKKQAAADNPEGPQIVNLGQAKLAGEIPGDRVSEPEKQSDWPDRKS